MADTSRVYTKTKATTTKEAPEVNDEKFSLATLVSNSKYYNEEGMEQWNAEIALIMTVNDKEYFETLPAEAQEAYQTLYDGWAESHKQGVIGYTDEQLSHIPGTEVEKIKKNQTDYTTEYLGQYGFADSEKAMEMAVTPENKYYLEADNSVTQKAYDEMALIMTFEDKEYMASLPVAQQTAIQTSVLNWEQSHAKYECFGHPDTYIDGIKDSSAQNKVLENSKATRDAYLTAMNEKYPELGIQDKIDKNTPEDEKPADENKGPSSVWGSIKNGVSSFFSKARETIGKTAVGAYILSKYDAVKDWVKSKIDPNYVAENPEDTKTDNKEPVKTDAEIADKRGAQADATFDLDGATTPDAQEQLL